MLRMIIADDEFIVRDGLINNIPWEEYGIEVIGQAIDGEEAYKLCQELQPDILFTDIRMPIMDGLEVAIKLKDDHSPIKIIIISGIQDFNYAKTALNVNAEGYILKPVKMQELKSVLSKVVHTINKERNREKEMKHLKHQLFENLPVIREKFLGNLVSGIRYQTHEIAHKLQYFNIPLSDKEPILVCVLQIDDYNFTTENLPEEDIQLLSFSILNIINEILTNHCAGISFSMNEKEFILILSKGGLNIEKCAQILEEIMSCLDKFLEISVSIGIGNQVINITQVNHSYSNALTALQYSFYTGKSSILHISDVRNISDLGHDNAYDESLNLFELEGRLTSSLKLGNIEDVSHIVDELFHYFSQNKILSIEYIQSICIECVCTSSRAICELGENLEHIVTNRSSIFDTIYKTDNLSALEQYIKSVFISLTTYFSQKHNTKNKKIIDKIKEIIHYRYYENIGVTLLSNEVYLTPNYISLIFKQETGETITEYITKIRMEKAKELLKDTDLKVLEIAEEVGFENPHYFSTVFKKYAGIPPQMYRTLNSTL